MQFRSHGVEVSQSFNTYIYVYLYATSKAGESVGAVMENLMW